MLDGLNSSYDYWMGLYIRWALNETFSFWKHMMQEHVPRKHKHASLEFLLFSTQLTLVRASNDRIFFSIYVQMDILLYWTIVPPSFMKFFHDSKILNRESNKETNENANMWIFSYTRACFVYVWAYILSPLNSLWAITWLNEENSSCAYSQRYKTMCC